MSSVNVDKALQIRPPIAVYVGEITPNNEEVFEIPGVPNNIGGSGPEGAHTMITNFISVQCCARATDGAVNLTPIYIAFGGESVTANPLNLSNNIWGNNPEPASGGCIEVPPGTTVRYDLSDLFVKGVAPALKPIEYMAVFAANSGAANNVAVRILRSSGR